MKWAVLEERNPGLKESETFIMGIKVSALGFESRHYLNYTEQQVNLYFAP